MNNENNVLPDNPSIQVLKAGQSGIFTNYIYKAIPLAFDESMSYYETLLGLLNYLQNVVIPTVNNNANAVAELQNLYIKLKNYVDDYFTNLDVQQEINNKLDAMVEDGTLTTLIGNYVQPLINIQNSRIDNINDKVNSVASGSPKGVYDTLSDLQSDNPDHDYIYVVSANGHWYYYNTTNSAWTDGGLYQAPVDSDDLAELETNFEYFENHTSTLNTSEVLYDYDTFVKLELEVGNITAGENANSNASRIRTVGYLTGTGKALIKCIDQTYYFTVARYYKESGEYYNQPVANSDGQYEMNLDLYKYRFVFRRADGTTQITDTSKIYDAIDIVKNTRTNKLVTTNVLNKTVDNIINNTIKKYLPTDTIQIIAHKGYVPTYPENTIIGYQKAVEMGFINLECDVRFTSDNIPVLLHDATIDRTSNGTGAIKDMTFEQAEQYDFGSWVSPTFAGVKMPSLEQFIKFCKIKNVIPYLEIKVYGDDFDETKAGIIFNILKKYSMVNHCAIFGTSRASGYFLSFDNTMTVGVPMTSTSDIDTAYQMKVANPLANVYLQGNYTDFDDTIINYAISKNLTINAWILDNNTDVNNLIDTYPIVNKITTDSLRPTINYE